jgi:hypothetical protein
MSTSLALLHTYVSGPHLRLFNVYEAHPAAPFLFPMRCLAAIKENECIESKSLCARISATARKHKTSNLLNSRMTALVSPLFLFAGAPWSRLPPTFLLRLILTAVPLPSSSRALVLPLSSRGSVVATSNSPEGSGPEWMVDQRREAGPDSDERATSQEFSPGRYLGVHDLRVTGACRMRCPSPPIAPL